jgi:hypothetical protein
MNATASISTIRTMKVNVDRTSRVDVPASLVRDRAHLFVRALGLVGRGGVAFVALSPSSISFLVALDSVVIRCAKR